MRLQIISMKCLKEKLPLTSSHSTSSYLLPRPHPLLPSPPAAVRTNGHHWLQYKILPDAGFATNISFEFECKAERDCDLLFGYRMDHSRQYRISEGCCSSDLRKKGNIGNSPPDSEVLRLAIFFIILFFSYSILITWYLMLMFTYVLIF